MKTSFHQVQEFHDRFGLPTIGQKPRELTDEEALFRIKFMIEELAEYTASSRFEQLSCKLCDVINDLDEDIAHYKNNPEDHQSFNLSNRDMVKEGSEPDLHGQLDALVDLTYVVCGTAHFHGFDLDGAHAVVHAANMTKVRATKEEQSKRGTTLDVVKPPGFKPPDLTEFLK